MEAEDRRRYQVSVRCCRRYMQRGLTKVLVATTTSEALAEAAAVWFSATLRCSPYDNILQSKNPVCPYGARLLTAFGDAVAVVVEHAPRPSLAWLSDECWVRNLEMKRQPPGCCC